MNYHKETYSTKHFTKNNKFIELNNDDCLKGLDNFPDKYFDVVVTSPPYNLGISYNSYNDNVSRDNYLEWFEKVSLKIKQKMRDNGSFFLNIGSSPSNPWLPFEIASIIRSYFVLQNRIHWI